MEYYWIIKSNTFESVLKRWMSLEPIMKSEVSQKEKCKYCILTHKVSEVIQSCLPLYNPTGYSLPDSSIYGIFQARVLEWIATFFSRRFSQPRDRTWVSHITSRCFAIWAIGWVITDTYMGPNNMVLMNLFSGNQWRNRYSEQIYCHGGGDGGEWEMNRESNKNIQHEM